MLGTYAFDLNNLDIGCLFSKISRHNHFNQFSLYQSDGIKFIAPQEIF